MDTNHDTTSNDTVRVLTILKDLWDQSMSIAKLNGMSDDRAQQFTRNRMTDFLNNCTNR